MQKANASIAIVALCVVLMAFGWARSQQAEGQIGTKALQWEYKVIQVNNLLTGVFAEQGKIGEKLTDDFNKLGTDGWEYQREIAGTLIVFKRPKR